MSDISQALDRQRLRAAYTSFATGVTVVATNDHDGRLWGMTASSFYSISLEPPLVSISLTRDTPSYNAFVNSKEYAISILSMEQSGLSRHFATPSEDKFVGVDLEPTGFASPVLSGTAAWMICSPQDIHEIGDHTLLVGRVLAAGIHDRPPLVYHRGTFYALADQATEEIERLRQRVSTVGFIVEYDDAVALVRDPHTASGWTLPMGRLAGGRTNSEALAATASRLIGESVEPDFLYSMIDINDHLTCLVYRGRLTGAPAGSSKVRWFAVEDIPWQDVSTSKVFALLKRYLEERVADQFGVFVNVGRGRIATITTEHEWMPDHAIDE